MTFEQLDQLTDMLSAINKTHASAFNRFSLTLTDIRQEAVEHHFNVDEMVATIDALIDQGNVGLGQFKHSEYLTHPGDNLDEGTVWSHQQLDELINKIITQMQVFA